MSDQHAYARRDHDQQEWLHATRQAENIESDCNDEPTDYDKFCEVVPDMSKDYL